ncbi:MAG TPA: GNAT family N-acetyltransferase [Actinoplanes sp.]|nr:GNAT family N-acetyltransferase [Actinoplanes sp.]
MRIERIVDASAVHEAAELFDAPPLAAATERFLAERGHHLLLAYDDEGRAVGMITGVEMTHPDKGTEMFVYELSVAPEARRRGAGTALVIELAAIARRNGCYGMWVGTEPGNDAAIATYRRAGASEEAAFTLLNWDLIAMTHDAESRRAADPIG